MKSRWFTSMAVVTLVSAGAVRAFNVSPRPEKPAAEAKAPEAKPAEAAAPAGAAKAAPNKGEDVDFDNGMAGVVESVTHDRGREQDPLKYLSGDMTNIVGDLSAYKTDHPVQKKEEKVISELDKLIKELEKACNGNGGANPNPTKPMNKSVIARGPGGGETHDAHNGDKQWGKLPPKERDKILQSKNEGFPPGYESLLQSYYQRLAQEKVTEDADAAKGAAKTGDASAAKAAPTTRPTSS